MEEWRLPDEFLMKAFSLMSVYVPRNGIILRKNCYVMITSFLTLIHRAIFTREIMIQTEVSTKLFNLKRRKKKSSLSKFKTFLEGNKTSFFLLFH